jgi:hypothetical protein
MKFKSNNKSKVIVGPNNTAGNAYLIANALNEVDVKADSYSITKHPFGYDTDFVLKQYSNEKNPIWLKKIKIGFMISSLNKIIKFIFFIKTVIKYDTFIYISIFSLFQNKLDLKILKFFKKKIGVVLIGCNERDPSSKINYSDNHVCAICTDKKFQQNYNCHDIEKKRHIVNSFTKYADYTFAVKDLTGFLSKNQHWNSFFVCTDPPVHNINHLLKKFNNPKIINITHLPSNKNLKGTNIINAAMKNLCNKYGDKINYISSRLTNLEVKEVLKKTHILIDQMHTYYALLSVEAMAAGCVVLCRIPDWLDEDMKGSPVINISTSNIEKKIESLINCEKDMKFIAKNSFQYYLKFHSLKSVGNHYKKTMLLK